jgi:hypothetical protein
VFLCCISLIISILDFLLSSSTTTTPTVIIVKRQPNVK